MPTSVYIPVFFSPQFCFLFFYSCSFSSNIQILYSCSSFYFSCLLLWHISCVVQTLLSDWDALSPHSSSQFPLLEKVLFVLAAEVLLASLAKLKAVAIAAVVPPYCSTSELVPHYLFAPSIFLFLFCFLSSSCPEQLLYHTIAQSSLIGILLPSTFNILFYSSFF